MNKSNLKFKTRGRGTKLTFFILFLPVFILVKETETANYYVRTDGNDSCNGLFDEAGLSGDCAFRTVQKAIDMAANPGDIVNIRGDHSGEHLPRTKANGCSGSNCVGNPTYITIRKTPGSEQEPAVISPGIQVNHSYIIVENLDIIKSSGWGSGLCGVTLGFSGTANHNIIRKNHIYNPAGPLSSCAVLFGAGSRYNVVENNLIEGDTNPLMFGGHHSGGSSSVLIDDYQDWEINQLRGRRIHKFTAPPWDGTDAGTVVFNDAHSITTSKGIIWNNNDCYGIGSSFGLPVIISGTDNIFRNNIIRNLINTERVFDALGDNTVIEGNEVSNMLDSNEYFFTHGLYGSDDDNCGAHTDLFQVVFARSQNVRIEANYFHDLQSQTGMLDYGGEPISDWKVINNIFANITHRNTIGGPGFKFWNNTFFNVALGNVYPLEGWSPGQEYRNNIIIGGSNNPDFGMIGGGPQGGWQECAKNVITRTWQANSNISSWIGQGGTQAVITANGSVYTSPGSGTTGSSQPDWNSCSNVGDSCNDNGIIWTNTVWDTICDVSGTVDVLFGDQWGSNRKNGVVESFVCNASAVPNGDPRIYDAEAIKYCAIKDATDNPASNNYYGIWNPPIYSPRTERLVAQTGDFNYINGGDPGFIAAFTDCVHNDCDFRLRSGSPLIGKGAYLVGVRTDKNGFPRTYPSSIGAYEYGSYPPSGSTRPAAPKGLFVR